MVGREGVEPSTSRLSGVRSNHLSYRPPLQWEPVKAVTLMGTALPAERPQAAKPAQAALVKSVSRMKGHEDGGMFFGQEEERVSVSNPP